MKYPSQWVHFINTCGPEDVTSNCPFAVVPGPSPPSFVKWHYYCESGKTIILLIHCLTTPAALIARTTIALMLTCCDSKESLFYSSMVKFK